jgi:predicted lysophospholipase L1 biosynthesis ABC-type transport system permease subunit
MAAMKRGEDWALGPRDRGAAKKLARDYVDAHRRPSEFYMYALIVLLVILITRNAALKNAISYLVGALILVILVDGYLIRNALRKLVAERAPGESTRGLTMYAVMRALQIRRMRMPAPRLKPGDKF